MSESSTAPSESVHATAAPLRVGLLVNSAQVSKYDYDLIKWSMDQPGIAITHLLVHGNPLDLLAASKPAEPAAQSLPQRILRALKRNGLKKSFDNLVWRYLETSEQDLLARADEPLRPHFDEVDATTLVPEVLVLDSIVSPSGLVIRVSDEQVAAIRALNFDVLIRCGDGILRGAILDAARFGVLSFHHADNRVNRGGPPGFWEVFHKSPTTGFTLQRLTEVLDGGQVFYRGHFPTEPFYYSNQANLFLKSNPFLQLLLAHLAEHRQLPAPVPETPYAQRLFRRPNTREMLQYLARRLAYRIRKKVRHHRGIRDLWHVGYVHSNWDSAELWRGKRLENPPGTFLADPFVIHRDNTAYCFVEELDTAADHGIISVYELGKDGGRALGVAIDEPEHMSFPYLFEFNDQLYMCPEISAARQVRLYRCDEFPLKWSLEKVLMDNIDAADTMLFEHEDRWWMFTNTDLSGTDEFCSELSIFWADSPLSTEWTPLPANPRIVDADRARNGGLLRRNGELFRVGQEQGFDTYGAAARVYQIVRLTPTEYEEVEVARVAPDFADNILGGHHLHADGGVTVFDFTARVKPALKR